MNFGQINNWLLVGGEDLIVETALILKECNQNVHIFTGDRNLAELLKNGQTLEANLIANKIDFCVSQDINSDDRINRFIDKTTILLSLSSPWIFKSEFIKKFEKRIINLHEANLPSNRGGATLSWMIMMDLKSSGSVLHFVTPGIDEGDIVLKAEYDFPDSCRLPEDYSRFIFSKSMSLIQTFIDHAIAGNGFAIFQQDNEISTYWPRLNTELQGFIDWDWRVDYLEKFIRSFDRPYGGSRCFLNGEKIILKDARVYDFDDFHPFQRGLIFRKSQHELYIAANGGALVVRDIRCLNGDKIYKNVKLGDRLHTPREKLEAALLMRPVYSSRGIE